MPQYGCFLIFLQIYLATVLASMDDESLYGLEFHRLGFGKAIELGILSDYKVVIFNVDQEPGADRH